MNIPLVYAGIGSRETPPYIQSTMGRMASRLYDRGWKLSTGGADGADTAFAEAVPERGHVLYLPWWGYNEHRGRNCKTLSHVQQINCESIAARLHPAWGRCSQGARKLHSRNVAILLSPSADAPVDAVICWTPKGEVVGGTGMGLRIAKEHGIPVFNLARETPGKVLECLRKIRDDKRREHTKGEGEPRGR